MTGLSREDRFSHAWAALDAGRLKDLLPELEPSAGEGGYLTLRCPACGRREAFLYPSRDGKAPRLHCNRKSRCGYERSLWDYLKERFRGDGKAAWSELARAAGLEENAPIPPAPSRSFRRFALPPEPPAKGPQAPLSLKEYQEEFAAALPGSPAEAFLKERGAPLERVRAMGFGYAPRFEGCPGGVLTYPLHGPQGDLTAIEGRKLGYSGPDKCLCLGKKGEGVFTAGRPLLPDGLHLCEGAMDAAALRLTGLNAVALCGTACPEWLRKALSFRKAFLAFDADPAGDEAARKLVEDLLRRGTVSLRLRPPGEGKDWGDYLREGGGEAVRRACLRASESLPTSDRPAYLKRLHLIADPRPDLKDDAALWEELLPRAYDRDGPEACGLFGVLHGFRCWGARLLREEQGPYLTPRLTGEGGGWQSKKEWETDWERWMRGHEEGTGKVGISHNPLQEKAGMPEKS